VTRPVSNLSSRKAERREEQSIGTAVKGEKGEKLQEAGILSLRSRRVRLQLKGWRLEKKGGILSLFHKVRKNLGKNTSGKTISYKSLRQDVAVRERREKNGSVDSLPLNKKAGGKRESSHRGEFHWGSHKKKS